MKKHLDISIVLPVYNEGENITNQINSLERELKESHEILIVYDFDQDNTLPPAKRSVKKFSSVFLVKNIYGKGVINAVKTGFEKSRGKYVVVMPADLADNPQTVVKMYKKIQKGFDIVCATRYGRGGAKIGGPKIKTFMSRMAGLSTPLLLGIPTTDIANGFKMYRRKVVDAIKIESDGGWEFAMEMVIKAKKLGFKISEVPTVWRDRTQGTSKFKLLKWLPKYIRWYLVGVANRLNIHGLVF